MEAEDVTCKRNEHGTKGSRQTNDMSHSIVLFGKYLRTKSENIKVGKTNKEESDVMNRKVSSNLLTTLKNATTYMFQAQAIMVMAGESCLSKPVTEEAKTSLGRSDNITECSNSCKLQAFCYPISDLPLARKISVHHFLQKRRSRIVSNSPYAGAPVNCCRNNGDTERKKTELRISMQN
ncbi:hypothetical protein GQ457_18G019960 [Hibiscus cannabinus]